MESTKRVNSEEEGDDHESKRQKVTNSSEEPEAPLAVEQDSTAIRILWLFASVKGSEFYFSSLGVKYSPSYGVYTKETGEFLLKYFRESNDVVKKLITDSVESNLHLINLITQKRFLLYHMANLSPSLWGRKLENLQMDEESRLVIKGTLAVEYSSRKNDLPWVPVYVCLREYK